MTESLWVEDPDTVSLSKAIVCQYYNLIRIYHRPNCLQPRSFAGSDALVRPQPVSTLLHCQYFMLLLATSASAFTGWRICIHTRWCISSVTHWLYCNALLANSSKAMTDKLQRVLNAAAWVVIGMKKFDPAGLSWLLHSELHCDWLDVPEWVTDKMAVMMLFSCLHMVKYLLDLCEPVSDVASRRTAPRGQWLAR